MLWQVTLMLIRIAALGLYNGYSTSEKSFLSLHIGPFVNHGSVTSVPPVTHPNGDGQYQRRRIIMLIFFYLEFWASLSTHIYPISPLCFDYKLCFIHMTELVFCLKRWDSTI